MKITVPAVRPDLDAPVDPRFGRCACFLVVDADTLAFDVVDNTAAEEPSGAGIAAASLVRDTGADAVIAGNLGPKAMSSLQAFSLPVYASTGGTIREEVAALQGGRLTRMTAPNVQEKAGFPGGGGRGMGGGGRGQGGGGRGQGGGGRGQGGGGRGMGGGGRGQGGGGRGMGGGGRGQGGGGGR
jgi:predicted Fe-Mo cluster-binding NifX family protein